MSISILPQLPSPVRLGGMLPASPPSAALPGLESGGGADSARFSMASQLLAQLHGDLPDALPGMLEPTPGNIRFLSAALAAEIGEIFHRAGIDPGQAVQLEVDDLGAIRVNGHRQDADRIGAVLDAHPQVQRLIRYLHALMGQAGTMDALGNSPYQAIPRTGNRPMQPDAWNTVLPGNPFISAPERSGSDQAPAPLSRRVYLILACLVLAALSWAWY